MSGAWAGRDLLLVDDDVRFRARLARALEARGLRVRAAAEGEEALALAGKQAPELAVVDLRMPGRPGLEVVRGLLERAPGTRVVVLTGYGSIASAVEAIRLGAAHYLTKPADAEEILEAFGAGSEAEAPAPVAGAAEPEPPVPSLARAEWEHIERVLHACGGNVSRAARLLGLHRRTLQRKLAKRPAPR